MPPITSRDFQRVAAQRFTTAETLLREKLTLDAQYFGGYTVECSLKALILHVTAEPDKLEKLKRITSGKKMHRPDVLLEELRNLGVAFRWTLRNGCGDLIGQPIYATRPGGEALVRQSASLKLQRPFLIGLRAKCHDEHIYRQLDRQTYRRNAKS